MLLVIAIGIGGIVLGVLGMMRSGVSQQQDELNQRLVKAQSQLKGVQLEPLNAKKGELEKRLSEATSRLGVVKGMFSEPVSSVAITNQLLDTAKTYGLNVTQVSSSGVTSDTLERVPCSVITLTAKVEGDMRNLFFFVTKLNSSFTTGVVKSVTITSAGKPTGENTTADIQLAVYSPR